MATRAVVLVVHYDEELENPWDCAAAHSVADLEFEGVVRCDAWPLDHVRGVYWAQGNPDALHLMGLAEIADTTMKFGNEFMDDAIILPVTTKEYDA